MASDSSAVAVGACRASAFRRSGRTILWLALAFAALSCGSEPAQNDADTASPAPAPKTAPVAATPEPTQALVLALAKFPALEPGKPPVPLPATLEFLVPAGEGAGYGGGIVSAAIDGIRAADAVVRWVASGGREGSSKSGKVQS